MTQSEAEKLARQLKHVDPYALSSLGPEIGSLCDHILSGDMKREIENAAITTVADEYSNSFGDEAVTAFIRALTTLAKIADTEG